MVQIVAMAQRIVLPREETRGRLEDLDSLLQLAVLAAKLLDLPSRLAGHPGAWPSSISAWRTHLRSVSAVIPSRLATAVIAAYSDG